MQRNLLVDNVLDEVEGKREDHGGVLFRANAVQSLGGELILVRCCTIFCSIHIHKKFLMIQCFFYHIMIAIKNLL